MRFRSLAIWTLLAVCGTAFGQDRNALTAAVRMPTYGQWHSSRIGGGGYVMGVVPSMQNPKRWYTYIDVGGLYRSDDGGQSWVMLHGALPPKRGNYSIRGLLVDPRDDNKLVIATGSRWSRTEGIYLSDDAGKTWRPARSNMFFDGNGPSRTAGFVLQRHPTDPDTLFAASIITGFFTSRDNGETWERRGLEGVQPTDLDVDAAQPDRIWVCAPAGKYTGGPSKTQPSGFFRTTDGGKNWEKLSEEPPVELVQDPKTPDTLYGLRRHGVVVSRDAGATWEPFMDGLPYDTSKTAPTSDFSYRALTAGPDFILVGSGKGSVYRLNVGEKTWNKVKREKIDPNGIPRAKSGWGMATATLIIDPRDPNHWLNTDYFGLSHTYDGGRNWKIAVDGIECTVVHCVTQDPTDPAVVHLGMADNSYFRSEDGGALFNRYTYPTGGITCKEIDLSPKRPMRLYSIGTTAYDQVINCVYISDDRGTTWKPSPMTGLPKLDKEMCTSIAVDPSRPETVYLAVSGEVREGGGGPYRSTDGGRTWTWIGQGLPQGKPFFWNMQWHHGRQIAVAEDGTVVVGSKLSGGLYVMRPDKPWTKANLNVTSWAHSLAADLKTPGRFYAALRKDGLFRSDDYGVSWKKISDVMASHVAADRAVAGRVAVATDNGVHYSLDAGATWTTLDLSLPDRVEGNMLAFSGDRLVVGSDGSGAFWIALSPEGEAKVAAKTPR